VHQGPRENSASDLADLWDQGRRSVAVSTIGLGRPVKELAPDGQRAPEQPLGPGEPREVERQLSEARRLVEELRPLAELGELSALIAHEIRNPVIGIAATAEVLRELLDPADERREGVEVILDEAERLTRLVGNLLHFVRTRQPRLFPTDIADDIDRVAREIAPDARRSGVVVALEAPERCTPVLVDSELIQQVFLNLAANAIQAMPHGGTLAVRTLEPDVSSAFVCVEFADTGRGIPPEGLRRVFEPFFTTRADGVGLGLAAARKLVEHQGGYITVSSEPGQGACFTVYLRRADAAEARS